MPLEMLFFQRPSSCAANPANEVLPADSTQESRQPGSDSSQLFGIPGPSCAAQPDVSPASNSAAQPSEDDGNDGESAVQPDDDVEGSGAEKTDEGETNAEAEEAWSVQTFSKTTSLYDDWLHRGPYL